MSSVYCIECEEQYGHSEVFDLKIFNKTVFWCLKCAGKQLEMIDLKIKEMSKKEIEDKEKKDICRDCPDDCELMTDEDFKAEVKRLLEKAERN